MTPGQLGATTFRQRAFADAVKVQCSLALALDGHSVCVVADIRGTCNKMGSVAAA